MDLVGRTQVTNVDAGIVDSHGLGQGLLGAAVGLVVLLELCLEDLDLFLGEARLCLSCPRHLVMMEEVTLVGIVQLHRLREVSGITGQLLRISGVLVGSTVVAPASPLGLMVGTHVLHHGLLVWNVGSRLVVVVGMRVQSRV